MDSRQVTASTSDPLWEEPRWSELHTIRPFNTDDQGVNDDSKSVKDDEHGDITNRAIVLDDAASELNYLCAADAPLADVQEFLTKWEDSASPDRIQSNALAWFNNSNALRGACANNNIDVVRLLLEKGLHPNSMALIYAIAKWKETGDSHIIKLLVDSGWDINTPLNDNTPPLMRLVFHALFQNSIRLFFGDLHPS